MARGRGLALMGGMVVGGAAVRSRARAQQRAYQQGQQAEKQAQQQLQQQVQQQAQQQPPTAAPSEDVTVELQKLAELHNSGVLTDQEFAAAKKKLLGY